MTNPGSQFVREVSGALKATINAHGPIGVDNIPSATKRVTHALREAMKRERDRIMTTQPRQVRGHALRLDIGDFGDTLSLVCECGWNRDLPYENRGFRLEVVLTKAISHLAEVS